MTAKAYVFERVLTRDQAMAWMVDRLGGSVEEIIDKDYGVRCPQFYWMGDGQRFLVSFRAMADLETPIRMSPQEAKLVEALDWIVIGCFASPSITRNRTAESPPVVQVQAYRFPAKVIQKGLGFSPQDVSHNQPRDGSSQERGQRDAARYVSSALHPATMRPVLRWSEGAVLVEGKKARGAEAHLDQFVGR